jgi:hypothetical protein
MRNWMRGAAEAAVRRPGTIALAVFAAGALLVGAAAVDGAGTEAQATKGKASKRTTLAKARSNGVRVTLAARRSAQRPGRATVRIAAFARERAEWRRLGRWRVVGAKRAWRWRVMKRYPTRQLTVRTSRGRFPVEVGVRLPKGRDAGSSAQFRFIVDRGRLRPVDV